MKVAVEWVRSFGNFESLSDTELANKLTMAGLEVEEIHGEGPSTVFVTKVTPNRGDWLSMYGVAREASAASSLPLSDQIPLTALPKVESIGEFHVEIIDEKLCPRFGAVIIDNIEHRSSPQFIQDRLTLAGMRPLNAVVDITNYVMLELGQPLHAYDISTLRGGKLMVRPAKNGETVRTLDGVEHALDGEILVIADAFVPVAIAGIMGGLETEVTESTRTIVLESAHFDASTVRRGAKKLGVSTEASYRFERFVDPELVPIALARASELLTQYASGTLRPASIDTLVVPIKPERIDIRPSRVNSVLGLSLTAEEVSNSLARLGLIVETDGDILTAFIPSFRPDLKREIDLIEEVGRMIGYWNLPETVPAHSGDLAEDFEAGRFDHLLRTILVGQGLIEAYSHTLGSVSPFDDPADANKRVTVKSSLSTELSGLRLTLLPHLLDHLALNLRFGSGSVRLFETGKVFSKAPTGGFVEPRHVAAVLSGGGTDYTAAKGIVENLADSLNILGLKFVPDGHHAMHSGRCAAIERDGTRLGYVAEVDPYVAGEHLELPPSTGRIAAFELNVEILRLLHKESAVRRYKPLPKFPAVTRDIALIYDGKVSFGDIKTAVETAAGVLLEGLSLLSIYSGERIGEGKKSVAVRLTFRSRERTLTETDAEQAVADVKTALKDKLDASER